MTHKTSTNQTARHCNLTLSKIRDPRAHHGHTLLIGLKDIRHIMRQIRGNFRLILIRNITEKKYLSIL